MMTMGRLFGKGLEKFSTAKSVCDFKIHLFRKAAFELVFFNRTIAKFAVLSPVLSLEGKTFSRSQIPLRSQ